MLRADSPLVHILSYVFFYTRMNGVVCSYKWISGSTKTVKNSILLKKVT